MDQGRIRDILSRAIGGFVSRVTEVDPVLSHKAEEGGDKTDLKKAGDNVTHLYR
jgi:hypothetical protein